MAVLTNIRQFVDTFVDFLQSPYVPLHELPVVVSSTDLYPPQFILYNTEQLTRHKELECVCTIARNPACAELWDYSAVNVRILADRGITAKHVPLRSSDSYVARLRSLRSAGQIYDIGFAGSPSERRTAVLDALTKETISVCLIQSWGEERDATLAKCRIILNIHYADDYKVFESARCVPWIESGATVISEHSLDDDPRCINVPYDQLVAACIAQLEQRPPADP
jgi:hypothetical protein